MPLLGLLEALYEIPLQVASHNLCIQNENDSLAEIYANSQPVVSQLIAQFLENSDTMSAISLGRPVHFAF